MLACKIPLSLKKHTVLYSFEANAWDDGSYSVEMHEWHVRSIQMRSTYLSKCGLKHLGHKRKALFVSIISKKQGVTWIKSNWANYIPKDLRISFEAKDRLPLGIYTTKLKALQFANQNHINNLKIAKGKLKKTSIKKEKLQYQEMIIDYERELRILKVRLSKLKKKAV